MQLAEPLISGIVFGAIVSAMVGPVFFTLLQTSLQEGFKAGSHLAFGIFLSDAACITLCYFFASALQPEGGSRVLVGLTGGTVLIGFGVYMATRKVRVSEANQVSRGVHARFVARGFFLNTANPAVLLFWLSVVGQVKLREQYEVTHELTFFLASLLTVFSIDLLKSYSAHKVKRLLKPGLLRAINIVSGVILFGYGCWMIWKAFK